MKVPQRITHKNMNGEQLLKKASGGDYVMPKKKAIKEHEHLVKVLREGKKSERKKEALKQEKELKKMKP